MFAVTAIRLLSMSTIRYLLGASARAHVPKPGRVYRQLYGIVPAEITVQSTCYNHEEVLETPSVSADHRSTSIPLKL